MSGRSEPTGQDTATGVDPTAKYDTAGYEDKSLGQAVNQDMELVDQLVEESGGDLDAAEQRFQQESAGAPALARQSATRDTAAGGQHLTGGAKAAEHRENEPPA